MNAEAGDIPHLIKPFSIFQSPRSPEVVQAWELSLGLLALADRACDQAGTRFSVYAFGRPVTPGESDPFGAMMTFAPKTDFDYIEEAIEIRVGFESGDLRFRTDRHFSAAGHAAAAQMIADHLRRRLN